MKLKLISMLLCMALLLTACGSKAASAEASASGSASAAAGAETTAADASAQSTAETAEDTQTDTAAAAADEQTEAAAEATPEVSEDPGISFPFSLDEGRLAANSVFQSSVPNPDCNYEEGENIATLEIVNQSGMYLDSAAYTVTLTDGEVFTFETDGIPDGATVWAFDLSNLSCDLQPAVADITCTAYYQESSPMMADQVSVEMDGSTANVTSLTDSDLTNLRLGFHGMMDNVYYGGLAIEYNLDTLPAYGSTSLEITESMFGDTAAVYVIQGDQ